MKFYSRSGLDQLLFENFFRGKRGGVFVDAGATDGETANNSLFFERFMDWRGLCVEPGPEHFAKLAAVRKCQCEQAPAQRLAALLEKHSLHKVDYCSIDASGAELSALMELDFARLNISLISVKTRDADGQITRSLTSKGYELFATLEHDLLFKRRDFKRLPRTSVICAVWHGDTNRHRLLEGHAENLAKQTIPIEPVYIFDGRDEPPAGLPGRKVVVHENMSIYQAWNVGLAMVGTPFVMNLNLDDRLATDAVEHLENALVREGAALVGAIGRSAIPKRKPMRSAPAIQPRNCRLQRSGHHHPARERVSVVARVNEARWDRRPCGVWMPTLEHLAIPGAFPMERL